MKPLLFAQKQEGRRHRRSAYDDGLRVFQSAVLSLYGDFADFTPY
jgi:hypothetical protein